MTQDYRNTVFLPKTEFPMRAGLAKREPQILARWEAEDLFARQREAARGREKFILHDGPPYANGHLHIGHALNKILKDVINRSRQMTGMDAHYIPGWDCHGLPIEWKVEEDYRAGGRDKDAVPILEFRRECREFAALWIDTQREEFKRLGVLGDWDNYYTTMSNEAEAAIAAEICRYAMNGGLYRGVKPVLWSVAEKTALADAEVEYHDHVSPWIHVALPVLHGPEKPAAFVIWTTTPWTIPGNRGLAIAAGADYVRVAVPGRAEALIVAEARLEAFLAECGFEDHEVLARCKGVALVGAVAAHPLADLGYKTEAPVMAADFVTMDQGTGVVHIAPGHGADDFGLGVAHGLEVTDYLDGDSVYRPHVPHFAGARVLAEDGRPGNADGAVIAALEEAGALLGKGSLRHSYPHSWRSRAPLIFRATTQWFISMETNGLREKALEAVAATRFVPESGRRRLGSMIENRPDWCVSRQRAWGVPIPVFTHRRTGDLLRDQAVNERVAAAFRERGGDAWFELPAAHFLGPDRDPEDWEQVQDIVEVWFDSGSTHAFVLEGNETQHWPASLYLEGSDQHRGWFHSSLLEAAGTRGRAPFDAVLTHGFVLDEDGRKMSKSLGNVTAPREVIDHYGADILRVWTVSADYSEDLRIGDNILKHQAELYRRIRNTLRYLLGNLAGFNAAGRVAPADMPELERWVLHRLWELDLLVRRAIENYDFHAMWTALHNFCAVDLSAFYLDIRKDVLYCDPAASWTRRSARTVLDILFDCLTAWIAPILCFTAEEAWLARHGDAEGESVHLRQFPDVPESWQDDELAARWVEVRTVRRVVTGAVERERAAKRMRSGLDAAPVVWLAPERRAVLEGLDLAEISIVSTLSFGEGKPPADAFRLEDVEGVAVLPNASRDERCARCWRRLPDVGRAGLDICRRCADAVDLLPPEAAA
ncbi:MAG: isoleucine--tRNA ligase [Alphaproteobacteria bacterium]|nr:isoleucine--tRNA ligase [Alphaproteobacteria bacterium]